MYTCQRIVTYSEADIDGRAGAAQIARYFQDCSTMHTDAIGAGLQTLLDVGKAWILASWQIDIAEYPVMGEQMEVSTWVYKFDAMYGYRNFLLRRPDGTVLAQANSLWIVMDIHTGHPVRLGPEITDPYGMPEPAWEMTYLPRRIRLPQTFETLPGIRVRYADLDTNRHVNNANYIALAMEYVPRDLSVCRVRVEYRNAAVEGSVIVPKRYLEIKADRDGCCTVLLCDPQDQVYAAVEMISSGQ